MSSPQPLMAARLSESVAPLPASALRLPITRPPRVLVVEDDLELAKLLVTLLQTRKYQYAVRYSGEQGLVAFLADPFDLVLTDMRMGSGNGAVLIDSVRRTSNVPIIVVTGLPRYLVQQVCQIENVAIISKPFDLTELLDLIHLALDTGSVGISAPAGAPPNDEPFPSN